MKERLLSVILITILSITMMTDVYAAVIISTSPYSGDYVLAINTSMDTATTQYSGNISVDTTGANNTMFSLDTTNSSSSNIEVSDVKIENGQKIYQIDPRNRLANMKAPITSTINAQYNMLEYQATYSVNDQKEFATIDFRNDTETVVYKYFTLMYSGSKCNIWLENNSSVNLNTTNISSMSSQFDSKIEPNMVTNFGERFDSDGDGKTAIMLYDIQDDFNYPTNSQYIGGFFDPNDLVGYNNKMDVLHIDTYPGMGINKVTPNVTSAYSTVVHENQHLINFSYSYENRVNPNKVVEMPVWLNEGLSMAAENMFYGALTRRIEYYNSSTYIRDGHSLFYWDYQGDVLSNYASSYLFVQYLRTQTKDYTGGGTAIYKWLIQNHNGTATVVENMMKQFYPSITLDDIQKNFRMATFLKETAGAQGFMGESSFNSVSPLLYTGSGTNLRGGGAVVKAISSPVTPTGYGSNIKFVGFKYDKVATPVANVVSGTVASGTQITLSCATSNATIYYTTDGSEPNLSSNYYNTPITITENTIIKAIAYKNNMNASDVGMYAYTIILPEITWKKNFGGSNDDQFSSIVTLNDGYIAVGGSTSFGNGDCDAIIVKFDISGTVVWQKSFGGSASDNFNSVALVSDGFIAVGNSNSASFGNGDWTGVAGKGYNDAIAVKYDTSGNVVWKKSFGGLFDDYYNSITALSDGYIAVGYSASIGNGDLVGLTSRGKSDAIIVKYDTGGNLLWKKNFSGLYDDSYNSIIAVNDGYIATGFSNSSVFGYGNAIIVKYGTVGNVVWQKSFGGSGDDVYNSITAVADGYVAVGTSSVFGNGDWTTVTGKGNNDAIIVKYDTSGNILWKKNFGGSNYDYYNSVATVNDGYIATGFSFRDSFGNGDWTGVKDRGDYDAIIVKYDTSGNVLWKRNFGSSSDDRYKAVTAVYDGCVAVGYSEEFGSGDWSGVYGKGSQDAIIVKYSSAATLPIKPLYISTYGICDGTTQLNLFPQSSGTYTVKAQYVNTTGKILNASFVVAIKNNNKLLKTHIIPSRNIDIDGVVDISQNIDLPSAASSPKLEVKVIAFDSILTLAPLSNFIVIGR